MVGRRDEPDRRAAIPAVVGGVLDVGEEVVEGAVPRIDDDDVADRLVEGRRRHHLLRRTPCLAVVGRP